MTTQELRDRTARQFREARKTPEGRALARVLWRAMQEIRKRRKEAIKNIPDWMWGAT
jgi:hypothetical protein